MSPGDTELAEALARLRDRLRLPLFPLAVPGADEARRVCGQIADQVDDYVLPRLHRVEAPLLAVVGGPTGAGKSALVNTLAGREVSAVGALRPTTRTPVLICAADDEAWFTGSHFLPTLSRSGERADDRDEATLHIARCDTLPAGLAVLDAPDFDSVVQANRELAAQLLGAADLWLFVTTAARYADAVGWSYLLDARDRGAAVAVVVDRCPDASRGQTTEHFATLLAAEGLGDTPYFVLPEVDQGSTTLPGDVVAGLRDWLGHVAGDAEARSALGRSTVDGILDSFDARLVPVIRAGERQDETVRRLRTVVEEAYEGARLAVDNATVDGSLVKGDVLARWRELVDTGALARAVRAGDHAAAEQTGSLRAVLADAVRATVLAHADYATEYIATRWVAEPAGHALLDERQGLREVGTDLPERARGAATAWQDQVTALVHELTADDAAKGDGYDEQLLGVVLMLVTVVPVGSAAGTEVTVARSATRASRKLLEAIFGGTAVRRSTDAVRRQLQGETHAVLESEAARYRELLDESRMPPNVADQVREVLYGVDAARRAPLGA